MESTVLHGISKNLERLILKHGISSVAELSQKTGIPRTTLTHLLYQKLSNPGINTLVKLTSFFHVSIYDLIDLKPETQLKEQVRLKDLKHVEKKLVPLIKLKDAISWHETPEWILQQKDQKWLPTIGEIHEKSFATLIETENRFVFQKNSIIIVNPLRTYNDGDYLVVSIRKNNPTIRRLLEESGVCYLESHSYGVPAIPLSEEVLVFGKIIENRLIY